MVPINLKMSLEDQNSRFRCLWTRIPVSENSNTLIPVYNFTNTGIRVRRHRKREFWSSRYIFKFIGTISSKINVKGTLHLKWVLKGHYHENHEGPAHTHIFDHFWPNFGPIEHSHSKLLFRPLDPSLGLKMHIGHIFGHFQPNLAKFDFCHQNHFLDPWTPP